jgi:hypothetical protein
MFNMLFKVYVVRKEVNMLLKMSIKLDLVVTIWIVQNDYKYDSLVICKEDTSQ